MRSSRWDAQGNIYLVTEESQTPDSVRANVGDTDGVLEVFRFGDDWVEIAIWNPDGSRAEMSGNGTRIAARWLAERAGATAVVVRVGPREVAARMLDDVQVEQDLGEVVVSKPEEVDGVRFVAVAKNLQDAVGVADVHAHGVRSLRVLSDEVDVALRVPTRRSHSQAPLQPVSRPGW